MDIKERIDTISASFRELPAAEQNSLLKRLKNETVAARDRRLEEIKSEMMELQGYQDELDSNLNDSEKKFDKEFYISELTHSTEEFINILQSMPNAFCEYTGLLNKENPAAVLLDGAINKNEDALKSLGSPYIRKVRHRELPINA